MFKDLRYYEERNLANVIRQKPLFKTPIVASFGGTSYRLDYREVHCIYIFKQIDQTNVISSWLFTITRIGKWVLCQAMDNQILCFGVLNNFRMNRKKNFKGHMVSIHSVTYCNLLYAHRLLAMLVR